MLKDKEANFLKLFGEEFARAYDEQFKRLKTEGRARTERTRQAASPREINAAGSRSAVPTSDLLYIAWHTPMSAHNRVIWSEGLFLQPQHFQQQERYFERYVETRCQPLTPNSWGFTEVEFERDLLTIGKFALRRVAGVFPDGTPFRMPEDDPLPSPIDIGADVRDQILSLAVPLRRSGELDIGRAGDADELARYEMRELQARNIASKTGDSALLEVAALRTRFLLQSDATHAYACVPLAQIVECRADKQVVLDESFIPTVMHTRTASRLATLTSELLGLFHQRGEALGGTCPRPHGVAQQSLHIS